MKEIFEDNDIYTNLKERLANPFIFSFAASWLFWNWPITLGLIWYNSENIKLLGYESYTELIVGNSNNWNNYYYPLIFAFLYTILLPLLKWGIDIVNAFFLRRNQDSVLKVTKTGYIPTLKYYDLKDSYDEYIRRLSKLVNDEGSLTIELNNLKAELLTKEETIAEKDKKIGAFATEKAELTSNTNLIRLEGEWKVKRSLTIGDKVEDSYWKITDTIITEKYPERGYERTYLIVDYVCDPISLRTSLLIMLDVLSEPNKALYMYSFSKLRWSSDFSEIKTINQGTLTGTFLSMHRIKSVD